VLDPVLAETDWAFLAGQAFAYLLIGGVVGAAIGFFKGRTAIGAVLGALLFIVGWMITALLKRKDDDNGEDEAAAES
jgi:uncharacterized membrane protein YdcZ (DUF606 family)